MQPALKTDPPEDRAQRIARDFEDFAYIVSHDLNAPLRHVKEFTKLLIGQRKANLTEEERQYVEFLEKSLQKLNDMQDALLLFSRLATHAGPRREVDFNQAVNAALQELAVATRPYSSDIKCGKLPTITAEGHHMQLLFFHLLGNAMKFYKD